MSDDLAAKITRFAQLDMEAKEAEQILEGIKTQRAEVEQELLLAIENGTLAPPFKDKVTGKTVYLRKDTYVSIPDEEHDNAIIALRECGLHDFVKESVSPQTLRSWVIELEKGGDAVPDEIAPHIRVTRKFSMRTRAK